MYPWKVFCPIYTLINVFTFTGHIDINLRVLRSFSSPNILFIQQPFNRKVNRQPWWAGWVCRDVAILVWFWYERFYTERYTASNSRPTLFHPFRCAAENGPKLSFRKQERSLASEKSQECLSCSLVSSFSTELKRTCCEQPFHPFDVRIYWTLPNRA